MSSILTSSSSSGIAPLFNRWAATATLLLSSLAQAADYPGKALFDYAMPFVVFLGLAAICLSIVGALFKPEIAKTALYAAMLMVVLFTILKTAPSLVSAVQQ